MSYVALAQTTLAANSTSVTFGSIPQTGYRDLDLVITGTVTESTELRLIINGDTGGTYFHFSLRGNGSSASQASGSVTNGRVDGVLTPQGGDRYMLRLSLLDAFTTKGGKTALGRYDNPSRGTAIVSLYWNNGSAITSLGFAASALGALGAGTTISLYGIAG